MSRSAATQSLLCIALIAVMAGCLPQPAGAQMFPALTRADFKEIAPQGFGDRQNSWAWSMAWFQGRLYVGTARSYLCVSLAAINLLEFTYPPKDPDVECTSDPKDLPLQAEIWSWSPQNGAWTLVFRSPLDVPIPGTAKFTARDLGFRGMHVFQEPDGTKALYAGSCSARMLYPASAGSGRLLRSTDGVNFTPVPQDTGTFLGDLRNSCFRGIETHNGKMYLIAGSFGGDGVVVESANPKLGNNSFRQITPTGARAYEIAHFNDSLYISFSHQSGFGLYRTTATGNPPYTFKIVFVRGGFGTPHGNPVALSMKVFRGSLFVGGDSVREITSILCAINWRCGSSILANGGAELFRVNADDTWDVVVGAARRTPDNPSLSGIGPGFNWPLNQHLWRMEVYNDRLYVGTYDVSTELRNAPETSAALAPYLGFDLWQTSDGIHFNPVDVTGFGDRFDYGVRSLLATPAGLFLGSANPFYGLRIYRAPAAE